MSILSFQLEWSWQDHDPQTKVPGYWLGNAIPFVDGERLLGGGEVFDAVEALVLGDGQGDALLFTCSCGVPECAGIFEPCMVESSEEEVSWILPEDSFRKKVVPRWLAARDVLEVRFDRIQYLAALDCLVGLAEEKRGAVGAVALTPADPPSKEELRLGVAGYVEMVKRGRVAKERQARERAATMGEALDWAIEARLPCGMELSGRLWRVAEAARKDALAKGGDVPSLEQSVQAALGAPEKACKALSYASAREVFNGWHPEPGGAELDEKKWAQEWARTLVKARRVFRGGEQRGEAHLRLGGWGR